MSVRELQFWTDVTPRVYEQRWEGDRVACAGTQTDFSFRVAVEEKARSLGCWEAISNLAMLDAVRHLQQKEQYTPCFGGEFPLIPLPPGTPALVGMEREKLCGVLECYWKPPCDQHRTMEKGMNTAREMGEAVFLPENTDRAPDYVVDELAQPLAQNREAVDAPRPEARREPVASHAAAAGRRTAEEEAVAGIINRLADSSQIFVSAIEEFVHQSATWSGALRQQLEDVLGRLDQFAHVVSEQRAFHSATQEKFEQLSSAFTVMQGADAQHAAEVEVLRNETREQAESVSGRLDEVSARLSLHQEEFLGMQVRVEALSHLESTVSHLTSKMAGWSERLDHQGEVLHSLCEIQNQRAAAMGQVLEALTRFKTSTVLPSAKP